MLSPSGRCMLPMLHLGAPVAFLEAKGSMLMAVTSTGLLWKWDLGRRACCCSCGMPAVSSLLGSRSTGAGSPRKLQLFGSQGIQSCMAWRQRNAVGLAGQGLPVASPLLSLALPPAIEKKSLSSPLHSASAVHTRPCGIAAAGSHAAWLAPHPSPDSCARMRARPILSF